MSESNSTGPFDPFAVMWTEWIKHTMPAGMAPPAVNRETQEHLRRVFFDMLAAQADQFMRSEAFLQSMKQATDHAVAWQKTLNDTMRRALSAAQIPTRSDSEHLVSLVRGMEERLMAKLEDLGSRVRRLEKRAGQSQ